MKLGSLLFAMVRADFLERTRRSSFLVTLCLVIFLGYSVNAGQVLIQLDGHRGVYNSAWVGSLMALVITFLLGLFGFYLVKNTIQRDEHTGVGQILATSSLTRAQYLLGKWLSNFAVLTTLVGTLAIAAVVMQTLQREDAQLHLWALIAPFLFVALPMMALVAALAVFFETLSWLKGGFGNLVYFFVFTGIFLTCVQVAPALPWLDVTGFTLIGSSMKAAARAAFPGYNGSFVLAMISDKPLDTFAWNGVDWTFGLALQRLAWLPAALGVALLGTPFFNRFDPTRRFNTRAARAQRAQTPSSEEGIQVSAEAQALKAIHLTPLARDGRTHFNFLRLAWLEVLLLVKGVKWYGLGGMATLWVGCVIAPTAALRAMCFMLAAVVPVLVWSKLGERDARHHTEALIFPAAASQARLLLSSWVAGVLITGVAASGALLGRMLHAEPLALLAWSLSVVFVPTLALALGIWSRSSKAFEVIYPVLWYLGPFNPQNSLAGLDYLGIHAQAPVHIAPLWMAGAIGGLLLLAIYGRRRQMRM